MAKTASIRNKTNAIRQAVLGEAVRDSIASAIDEIDDTVVDNLAALENRIVMAEQGYAAKNAEFTAAAQGLKNAEQMQEDAEALLSAVTNIRATVEPTDYANDPSVDMSYDSASAQFVFKLPRAPKIQNVIGVQVIGQTDTPSASYDPQTGVISLSIPATAKAVSAFAQPVAYDEENDKLGEPSVEYNPNTGRFVFGIPSGKPGTNATFMLAEMDKRLQLTLLWENAADLSDPTQAFGEQVILSDDGKLDAYNALLIEFQALLPNYYKSKGTATTRRTAIDRVYALVWPGQTTKAQFHKHKSEVDTLTDAHLSRRVRFIRGASQTVSGTVYSSGVYFGPAWVNTVSGTAAATTLGYVTKKTTGIAANCSMFPTRIFGLANVLRQDGDGRIVRMTEEGT